MSERFRDLLAQWKEADAKATAAQRELGAQFQAFIDGTGPEPSEKDRERAERLRSLANAALEVALAYVKATAKGPDSHR